MGTAIRTPEQLAALRALAAGKPEAEAAYNAVAEVHPIAQESPHLGAFATNTLAAADERYRMFGENLRAVDLATVKTVAVAEGTVPKKPDSARTWGIEKEKVRGDFVRGNSRTARPSFKNGNAPIFLLNPDGTRNTTPDPGTLLRLGASDFPNEDPFVDATSYLKTVRDALYSMPYMAMNKRERALRNIFAANEFGVMQAPDGGVVKISTFDPLAEDMRKRLRDRPIVYYMPDTDRKSFFRDPQMGSISAPSENSISLAEYYGHGQDRFSRYVIDPLLSNLGGAVNRLLNAFGEVRNTAAAFSPYADQMDSPDAAFGQALIPNTTRFEEWYAEHRNGQGVYRTKKIDEIDAQNYKSFVSFLARTRQIEDTEEEIAAMPISVFQRELELQHDEDAVVKTATHNARVGRILADLAMVVPAVQAGARMRQAGAGAHWLTRMAGLNSGPLTNAAARGVNEAVLYAAGMEGYTRAAGRESTLGQDLALGVAFGVPLEMALPLGRLAYYDLRGRSKYAKRLVDDILPFADPKFRGKVAVRMEEGLRDIYIEEGSRRFRGELASLVDQGISTSRSRRMVADELIDKAWTDPTKPKRPDWIGPDDAALPMDIPVSVRKETPVEFGINVGIPNLGKPKPSFRVKLNTESVYDALSGNAFGRRLNKNIVATYAAVQKAMGNPGGGIVQSIKRIKAEAPSLADARAGIKTIKTTLMDLRDAFVKEMGQIRDQAMSRVSESNRALLDLAKPNRGEGAAYERNVGTMIRYYLNHENVAQEWYEHDLLKNMVDSGVRHDVLPIAGQLLAIDRDMAAMRKLRGKQRALVTRAGDNATEVAKAELAKSEEIYADLIAARDKLTSSAGLTTEREVENVLKRIRKADAMAGQSAAKRRAIYEKTKKRAVDLGAEANFGDAMNEVRKGIRSLRDYHDRMAIGEATFAYYAKEADDALTAFGHELRKKLETQQGRLDFLMNAAQRDINTRLKGAVSTAMNAMPDEIRETIITNIDKAVGLGLPRMSAGALDEASSKLYMDLVGSARKLHKVLAYAAGLPVDSKAFKVRDIVADLVKREVTSLKDLSVVEAVAVKEAIDKMEAHLRTEVGKRIISLRRVMPSILDRTFDELGFAVDDVTFRKGLTAEEYAKIGANRKVLAERLRQIAIVHGVPVEVLVGKGTNVNRAISMYDKEIARVVGNYAAETADGRLALLKADPGVAERVAAAIGNVLHPTYTRQFASLKDMFEHIVDVSTQRGKGLATRIRGSRAAAAVLQTPDTLDSITGSYGLDGSTLITMLRSARHEILRFMDPLMEEGGVVGQMLASVRDAVDPMEKLVLSGIDVGKSTRGEREILSGIRQLVGMRIHGKYLGTLLDMPEHKFAAQAPDAIEALRVKYESALETVAGIDGVVIDEKMIDQMAQHWERFFDDMYEIVVQEHTIRNLPIPKKIDVGFIPLREKQPLTTKPWRKRTGMGTSEKDPGHWFERDGDLSAPFEYDIKRLAERYVRDEIIGLVLRDARTYANDLASAAAIVMSPKDASTTQELIQFMLDEHMMISTDRSPGWFKRFSSTAGRLDTIRLSKAYNVALNMLETFVSGGPVVGMGNTFSAIGNLLGDNAMFRRIEQEMTEAGTIMDVNLYSTFSADQLAARASKKGTVMGRAIEKAYKVQTWAFGLSDKAPRVATYRAVEIAVARGLSKISDFSDEAWETFAKESHINWATGRSTRLKLHDLFTEGKVEELRKLYANSVVSSTYVDFGPGGRGKIFSKAATRFISPYSSFFAGRATYLMDSIDELASVDLLPKAEQQAAYEAAKKRMTRLLVYDGLITSMTLVTGIPLGSGTIPATAASAYNTAKIIGDFLGIDTEDTSGRGRMVSPTIQTAGEMLAWAFNFAMSTDMTAEQTIKVKAALYEAERFVAENPMSTKTDFEIIKDALAGAKVFDDQLVDAADAGRHMAKVMDLLAGYNPVYLTDILQNLPNAVDAALRKAPADADDGVVGRTVNAAHVATLAALMFFGGKHYTGIPGMNIPPVPHMTTNAEMTFLKRDPMLAGYQWRYAVLPPYKDDEFLDYMGKVSRPFARLGKRTTGQKEKKK